MHETGVRPFDAHFGTDQGVYCKLPHKLAPPLEGPFVVLSHPPGSNDVTCKHVNLGHVRVLHSSHLYRFEGTYEEARAVAQAALDQVTIARILAWSGDPDTRTTMEFLVEFADGEQIWKVFDQELSNTQQFEDFVRSNRPLRPRGVIQHWNS